MNKRTQNLAGLLGYGVHNTAMIPTAKYIQQHGLLGTIPSAIIEGTAAAGGFIADDFVARQNAMRNPTETARAAVDLTVGTNATNRAVGQSINQNAMTPNLAPKDLRPNGGGPLNLRFSGPVLSDAFEPRPVPVTQPTVTSTPSRTTSPTAPTVAPTVRPNLEPPVYKGSPFTPPETATEGPKQPGTSGTWNTIGYLLGGAAQAVAGPYQEGTGAQLGMLGQQVAQNKAANTYLSDLLSGKEPDARALAILPPETRTALLQEAENVKDRKIARNQAEVKMQMDLHKIEQDRLAAEAESGQRAVQLQQEQQKIDEAARETPSNIAYKQAMADYYKTLKSNQSTSGSLSGFGLSTEENAYVQRLMDQVNNGDMEPYQMAETIRQNSPVLYKKLYSGVDTAAPESADELGMLLEGL